MDYLKILKKNPFFEERDDIVLDKLTGVLSRDSMFSYIDSLIKNDKKFSFCIFDIDNFKTINDTYGHMVGDEILIAMSSQVAKLLKNEAILGRYGGDEFMVVWEDISEYDDIWKKCFDFHHEMRKNPLTEICGVATTITMGISRYPLNAHTREELFMIADKALYRGKDKGRNCYIIYLPEKHSHLVLDTNKQIKLSNIYILGQCLSLLRTKEKYNKKLKSLFSYILTIFKLDHICFQDTKKVVIDVINENCDVKDFGFIPHELLWERMELDYFKLDRQGNINIATPELLNLCNDNSIRGLLAIKVFEGKKELGIIRCEMAHGDRIWQDNEVILLQNMATLIAKDIYYQKIKF